MSSPSPKRIPFVGIILSIILVVLAGGLITLGYLYYQTRQQLSFLSSPAGQEELARREVDRVVSALSQLAVLPEEEPVVATITDPEALASESAFYDQAETGDKLVVYPEAQRAYIYSPSRDKIVNVGPLLIEDAPVGDNSNGTTQQVGGDETAITLEIRNGSTTPGLATDASTAIAADLANVEITAVTEAARTDYEQATVIDLSGGNYRATVQALADEYNAQILTRLPEGEPSSDAAIVLIVAG